MKITLNTEPEEELDLADSELLDLISFCMGFIESFKKAHPEEYKMRVDFMKDIQSKDNPDFKHALELYLKIFDAVEKADD